MAKSTQVITDAGIVAAATPTAATLAKSTAAAGPIMDVKSNAAVLLLECQSVARLAANIKASTDAGDPLLTTLQQIIDVFV